MSGNEYAVKINHGGVFKKDSRNKMIYSGSQAKTSSVDPDLLCGFDIAALARECGPYEDVHGVYYLEPGRGLDDGLYRVFDDVQVREVSRLIVKYRSVELYVQHTSKMPIDNHVLPTEKSPTKTLPIGSHLHAIPKRPSKLTPQKKLPSTPLRKSPRLKESSHNKYNDSHLDHSPTFEVNTSFNASVDLASNALDSSPTNTTTQVHHISKQTTKTTTKFVPEDYEWEDNRPDSPLLWKDLLKEDDTVGCNNEENDGEYEPKDETDLDSDGVELEEEAAVVVDDEWFGEHSRECTSVNLASTTSDNKLKMVLKE